MLHPWRQPETLIASLRPGLLERLNTARIDLKEIGALAATVAYETTFAILNLIDEGYTDELSGDPPGWVLMEIDAASERLTGRDVRGLHESLLETDPLGMEGRDFLPL